MGRRGGERQQNQGPTQEELEALGQKEATLYRAMSARANYLSQDRSDIQVAVKELTRSMSAPTAADRLQLKRLARYLIDRPRVVIEYNYQSLLAIIDGWSDSD